MADGFDVGDFVMTPHGLAKVVMTWPEIYYDFGRPKTRIWVHVEMEDGRRRPLPSTAVWAPPDDG